MSVTKEKFEIGDEIALKLTNIIIYGTINTIETNVALNQKFLYCDEWRRENGSFYCGKTGIYIDDERIILKKKAFKVENKYKDLFV